MLEKQICLSTIRSFSDDSIKENHYKTRSCNCPCVCNLNFLLVISWVLLLRKGFSFKEISKRFYLHHQNIYVSMIYCFACFID
jgi:hypothetical protein